MAFVTTQRLLYLFHSVTCEGGQSKLYTVSHRADLREAEGSLQATRHIRVPVVCSTVSLLLLPAVPSTNNSYLYHSPAAGLFSPETLLLTVPPHVCVCVCVCWHLCMSKRLRAIETPINYSIAKSEASWQQLTDDSRGH